MRYKVTIVLFSFMFYSHIADVSFLKLYDESKEERLGHYLELVSLFRGDDARDFLCRIYDLSTQHCLDFDMAMRWIYTESRFNPNAVSSAGALGVCQLMPQTAKLIARVTGYSRYNLFNEEDNLNLGFAFFSLLLKECDYDYEQALARYLAGPKWENYIDSDYVRFILFEESNTLVHRILRTSGVSI